MYDLSIQRAMKIAKEPMSGLLTALPCSSLLACKWMHRIMLIGRPRSSAKRAPAYGRDVMPDFVRICSQSELPAEGNVREFTIDGRALCVARVNGEISVLDGICPHEGGPLGEGSIEGGKVVCPWHAYAFDVHTGANDEDPDVNAVVIEAKVENGELRAKL
jgi:nitrite reductase (NADH) small subunit